MRIVRRFLFGLSYLPAALFAIIVVSYIVKTWLVFNDEKVGFELATVSALLGGFILTGAFIDRQSGDRQTRLRRIGVVYMISTIAFVVFGLSVPVLNDFSFMPYAGAIGIAVGALCFAMGTVLLVMAIPSLWHKEA